MIPSRRRRGSTSMRASSRGLGELLSQSRAGAARRRRVGGTATIDGGAGLRDGRRRAAGADDACSATCATRCSATRRALFGPQKGATPEQVDELEARLASLAELAPYRDLPGAGAGGRARRGVRRRSAPSSSTARSSCSTSIGFDERARTRPRRHRRGHASTRRRSRARRPARCARRCARLGVRCVLFGGLVARRRSARDARALGRPGAGGRRSRRARRGGSGRACSTRRASSSTLPCALSSFAAQNA